MNSVVQFSLGNQVDFGLLQSTGGIFAQDQQLAAYTTGSVAIVLPFHFVHWNAAPRVSLERAEDIIRRIDQAVLDEREDGEFEPTQHAVGRSKELVASSSLLAKGLRFSANIVPLDGSIRITWQSLTRNVRLVCPAYSEPYIYHERLLGRHSVEFGSEKATPEALTAKLRWLGRSR